MGASRSVKIGPCRAWDDSQTAPGYRFGAVFLRCGIFAASFFQFFCDFAFFGNTGGTDRFRERFGRSKLLVETLQNDAACEPHFANFWKFPLKRSARGRFRLHERVRTRPGALI